MKENLIYLISYFCLKYFSDGIFLGGHHSLDNKIINKVKKLPCLGVIGVLSLTSKKETLKPDRIELPTIPPHG